MMPDVIDQLAAYRSRVIESTEPVTLDDVVDAHRKTLTAKTHVTNRWRSAVAAAAVIALLAGVWAVVRDRETTVATGGDFTGVDRSGVGDQDVGGGTDPSPAERAALGYGPGWHELDAGPLEPRSHASVTWTGTELVVLGGDGHNDGAAYNPTTRTWRPMATPPFPDGGPLAVWTGTELLAVGPDPDPSDDSTLRTVAAYDPGMDAWHPLASVDPTSAHGRAADAVFLRQSDAFWTGSELLWAGAMMRYDRGADRWEALPLTPGLDAPAVGRHFAWTGSLLLLAQLGADTLGLDLQTREWLRLGGPPPAALGYADSAATWDGTELIVAVWWNEAAAFEPASGSWRELPPPPNEQSICRTRALIQGGIPLFEICGRLYRFADGNWTDVGQVTHDAPKATLFTQLIDAGDAVLLWASDGGPGDPANPDLPFTQFEIWVPPSVPASPAP
jgi:hypothetical protein